ncbi:MAG: type II secretion system F family protein [Eubacteriales bacterium]|nr:type II secretion system F family protein [Eubacteriales bacterium]
MWEIFGTRKNSKTQVVRYDRYRLSAAEAFTGLAKGILAAGLLAWTFYRSIWVFFAMLPAACAAAPVYEAGRLKKKRLQELTKQVKESMVVLASHLSAGLAMENALAASRGELVMLYGEQGMIVKEFTYMVEQIRVNRTVEQMLEDFAERSGLEDVQNFAEVFSAAKRGGGDISGIMRHTAEVIRDKMQVREEIRTLTASRQLEQKIMSLFPFFIVFYVEGASPGFFELMYGTDMGRLLMSGCLAAYLASLAAAKRILDIPV